MNEIMKRFMLNDKVCIITGGAGLMGDSHAKAILSAGGVACLIDINGKKLMAEKVRLQEAFGNPRVEIFEADITQKDEIEQVSSDLIKKYGHIDVLINNAANNPKVEGHVSNMRPIGFEDFSLTIWEEDIAVGLTGALICTQVFGGQMAKQGFGVILNISSDLGIIAPDQRIYEKKGLSPDRQIKKPVTYSVIKHGLIGLTKYTATYWGGEGVRCNSLCPAGIENGQDDEFIIKLTNLVPMGRMATKEEYQNTVIYMVSDASKYMTGATVIVDGGRTCW